MKHSLRRLTGALLGTAVAVGGLTVVAAPAQAAVTTNTLSFTKFDTTLNTSDAYLIDSDGTNLVRPLVSDTNTGLLSWSPDMSKVIYTSGLEGSYDIWTANADFTGTAPLPGLSAADRSEVFARYSRNGSMIAFGSSPVNAYDYQLAVANADGSGARLVTNVAGEAFIPMDWTPDGSSVLVEHQRYNSGAMNTLALVRISDGQITELTPASLDGGTNPFIAYGGSVTADGSRVVFAAASSWTQSDIYSINIDGTGLANLSNGAAGHPLFPALSPDGTKVAYSDYSISGNMDLYLFDLTNASRTQLTSDANWDMYPIWAAGSGNTSGGGTPVVQEADLSIAMSADKATPAVGDTVTVTFAVANNGPSAVSTGSLEFTLPTGLSFAADPGGPCSLSGQTMTCSGGPLQSGWSGTLTAQVKVDAAGTYALTATVSSAVKDPNPDNNSATVNLTSAGPAGIATASAVAPETAIANADNGLIKAAARKPTK